MRGGDIYSRTKLAENADDEREQTDGNSPLPRSMVRKDSAKIPSASAISFRLGESFQRS